MTPSYNTIIKTLNSDLSKERKFQHRMAKEGAASWQMVNIREKVVEIFETLGEENYDDLAGVFRNNIKSQYDQTLATNRLKSVLHICKDSGLNNDQIKQIIDEILVP